MLLTHKQDNQEKLTIQQLLYMVNAPVLVYYQDRLWGNDFKIKYVLDTIENGYIVCVEKPSGETRDLHYDEYDFYQAEISNGIDMIQDITPIYVSHPPHYTQHPSGIECIEITRHMNFCLGNAMKYIWRAGLKDNVSKKEDLQKAIWYLEDEIKNFGR